MSSSLQKILNNINGHSAPVELQGLAGSSKALVVSMLSKISGQSPSETSPVVVVCESFDIAEVLLHDIYYYFGREGVYFFPLLGCASIRQFFTTQRPDSAAFSNP